MISVASVSHRPFRVHGTSLGHGSTRWILYQLSHQGSPRLLEWVAYPGVTRRTSWVPGPPHVAETSVLLGNQKRNSLGTSPKVQQLRLCASTAGATGSVPGWKRKRERETSCFVYSKENDRVSVSTSKSQESLFCSRGSISFLDPRALKSVESEVEGTGNKSSMRVVSSNGEGRDFPCDLPAMWKTWV